MSIDIGSAWGSPRRSKLLVLTVLGLVLLLLVPLYQLSDHESGLYSHLTKYLGHDGPSQGGAAQGAFHSDSPTGNATPGTTPGFNTDDGDDGVPDELENVPEGIEDVEHKDKSEEHRPQQATPTGNSEDDQFSSPEETSQAVASEETEPTEVPQVPEFAETAEAISSEENKPTETPKTDESDESEDLEESKATETPHADKTEAIESAASQTEQTGESAAPTETTDAGKIEEELPPPPAAAENHKEDEHTHEDAVKEDPNNPNLYPESRKSACDGFPALNNITLVMKTGATEAFEKLPTQLLTSLQCIDDFLLFSDLEQNVGNYHVYDVLSEVTEEAKHGLMEFDLYDAQADCPVSQKDCTGEMNGGWELDKYKFLHMIERTWKMRPNKKWYVFAEADSYVFWPNLIYWLDHKVTPEKHPYVGSVALLKNMPFAHGGSGYVISGETVEMMAKTPGLANKYDLMAPHECCGDYLMALAVNDTGSLVKQAHPMFNGEKPNTLPYGHGHWCEPMLTMHHMNSEEVSSAWFYEQTRKKRGIVQIKEMYEAFMAPNLVPRREQYDNLSDDVCYLGPDEVAQNEAGEHEKSRQKPESEKNAAERGAHSGPDHCAAVCLSQGLDINEEQYNSLGSDSDRYALLQSKYDEKSKDRQWNLERQCFQWRYHKKACCIARSFKLGKPRTEERAEERWTSGWFIDGINKWIEGKGDCKPEWKNID